MSPVYTRDRTRLDVDYVDLTVSGAYGTYGGAQPGVYPVAKEWRRFRDAPHAGLVKGRYPATPCYDQRATVTQTAPLPTSSWTLDGQWTMSSDRLFFHPGWLYDLVWEVEHLASGLNPTLHRMMTSLMTQIPAEVELGNFAIEAKQSLELIPSLVEHWHKLLSMQRVKPPRPPRIGRNGKPLPEKPRRVDPSKPVNPGAPPPDPTKEAADHSLWWQFGAAPLISDLEKLTSLGEAVGQRLERLRTWNGRVVNRRAGPFSVVELPGLRLWHPLWLGSYGTSNTLTYRLESVTSEVRANVRLDSHLEGLDGWEGITAAALAATGLNNPLAVVYNAIPFSFVLDWFTPVGDRLARVGATPIRGRWQLSDWTWSHKLQARFGLRCVHWVSNPWTTNLTAEVLVGHVDVSVYVRDIEFPSFPFSWPLSAGQAGNALALVLTTAS